jgi:hypothetical protein
MYYRTQEIEKELGMYKNLYIQSLDDQAQKKAFPDDQPFLLLIKEMAASHRGPTVRKSVPLIAVLLISSWIAFMILQLLVLLHVV